MPIDPTPSTDPDGAVEIREGRRVLRYERHLDHPPQRVWAALTEPRELIGWLAEAELEPVDGAPSGCAG